MRRIILLGALIAVLLSASGCAVLNEENRYASRVVASMWPEPPAAQVLVCPVLGPLWVGALLADAIVINPVLSLPEAFITAGQIVGAPPALPIVEIVVGPMRLLAFPFVFLGAELTYIFFPV